MINKNLKFLEAECETQKGIYLNAVEETEKNKEIRENALERANIAKMNYNQAIANGDEKMKTMSKLTEETSLKEARKAIENLQKYKKIAEDSFNYAKNKKYVKEGILWGLNWDC